MISWIIIVILLAALLILAKMRHIKHKFLAFLIVLLLIFFYVTATRLFSGSDIDFKSFEGLVKAGKLYFSWLFHAFGNVKEVAGDAIKMDWVGNSTLNLSAG